MNVAKSNAIPIEHAFSGDAHAVGVGTDGKPAWWDNMIGPGQGHRHQSVFRNLLECAGRLQGDDGSGPINPATAAPYAMSLDMVRLRKMFVDSPAIRKLGAAAGEAVVYPIRK